MSVPKIVKIFCSDCYGRGYLEKSRYPAGNKIKVVCPVCDGKKYVTMKEQPEKEEAKK